MEEHRIAVISDTHGLLRPEIVNILKTCEIILHAGDVGTNKTLSQLQEITNTYAVCGNADKELAGRLPEEIQIEIFGFQIYMIHNKKSMKKNLSDLDFVIYGHSHKYEDRKQEPITFLNPGSCGPRRFRQPVTMMLLTLYENKHQFCVEKIDCTPTAPIQDGLFPQKDMHKLIKKVIKDTDAGKQIADIALRNQINEELAEQICRIYVTHPGVDVDGILDRMERKNL